ETSPKRRDLVLAQRRAHRAVGDDPLIDIEAQRALDQRLVLLEEEIVGIGPIDAPDLVNIAKALGGEKRGLGAGALEESIDGDGRAVEEKPGLVVSRTRLGNARIDAFGEARRSRQALAEQQPAAFLVERRDIGEGTADIGADPHIRHEPPFPQPSEEAQPSWRRRQAQFAAVAFSERCSKMPAAIAGSLGSCLIAPCATAAPIL